MTIDLNAFLLMLLYMSLIILVIIFIVIGIKLIKVLDKTDNILDDVDKKIESFDGVFDIIDKTSGFANTLSDKIIDGIAGFVGRLFKKKKESGENE